ncbi:hypothetical protein GYMLUDRAFT_49457 [Collybiopsis luxurians FD-317 M1]|uniref:CUE domain-containing protein n=1 Tax=Collybiopsis luxurians FD-317 M1 TaxID=944289 RepID=A0A0D0BUL8_9AGAR|nr:hypothetical protein GYMLUDRAFT_49457 [Collybiopsis luxurians FD-317 M1]
MSFEYAPVTKGLMTGLALTSIVAGVFDIKHYFHLQLVPHISKYHQYWRLGLHNIAFANSSDLFLAELILFQNGVQVERCFGSLKYASFILVSTLLSTLLEFIALLLFHRVGLNHLSSGPLALVFSVLYQYARIIPPVYEFRVFGLALNNKSYIHALALQLAVARLPGSGATALIGILAGQMYRSDLINLKSYRIGLTTVNFATRFIRPYLGSNRPPRRSNRAFPDTSRRGAGVGSSQSSQSVQNEEVVTTARPSSTNSSRIRATAAAAAAGAGGTAAVRDFVQGLTGRGDGTTAGVRIPPESEITELTNMFPDISREAIIGALQRSRNIEGAVETLLSSQIESVH